MIPQLIGAGLSAVTGLIGANQARQDKKHAMDLTNQSLDFAKKQYGEKQGYRDKAMQRLLNPDGYNFGDDYAGLPQYKALDPTAYLGTGNTDAYLESAAKSLNDSPDRVAMAKQIMSDWDTAEAPALAARYRKVGQKAGALGRVGAQGVASELGTVLSDSDRNRGLARNSALRDALDAGQGDKLSRLSAFANLQNQRFGQGLQRYNAEGNERSYRDYLAGQGVNAKVQQRDRETGQRNTDFAQGGALYGMGYSNDPTSAYNNAANTYAGSAAQNAQGAGDALGLGGSLFQQFLASQKKSPSYMNPDGGG